MLAMINFLLNIVDLFFSDLHRRNRRFEKARRYLNKILNRDNNDFEFIIAYDALIMVGEDRLSEARLRFEECQKRFSKSNDEDGRYISLYCEFWLSVFNSTGKALEFRSEALKLESDSLIKSLLRFPNEEKVKKIVAG